MVNPVAALGALPSVQGFGPLPTSVVIPFMSAQSASMMLVAGINWQAGKRWVDAMKNDQFNDLMKDLPGFANIQTAMAATIAEKFMQENSLSYYRELPAKIIDEMVELEKMKVNANVRLITELPPEYLEKLGQVAQGSNTDAFKNFLDWLTGQQPSVRSETNNPSNQGPLPGTTTGPGNDDRRTPEPEPTQPQKSHEELAIEEIQDLRRQEHSIGLQIQDLTNRNMPFDHKQQAIAALRRQQEPIALRLAQLNQEFHDRYGYYVPA